jgi:CRP-like cAMP-binding protein
VILTDARAAFLRRIHLFRDLKDEDLAAIAGMFKEEVRKEGEIIFSQGDEADRFFIIYQGKVRITMIRRKEERELATLIGGDYFGEEALLSKRERSATVTAVEKTYLNNSQS